jgi:hypothetical protein
VMGFEARQEHSSEVSSFHECMDSVSICLD